MSLQEIKAQALKLKELRDVKAALNDELSEVNSQIRDLEEFKLNTQMEDMGLSDVTIDGIQIKRGVVFRGSITTSTDKKAFDYLFESENEGALKQMLMIDIAEIDPEFLTDLLNKANIPYEIKYTIHHATLSSILRELVEDGKLSTADFEKYKIYAQPQIKVNKKEETNG